MHAKHAEYVDSVAPQITRLRCEGIRPYKRYSTMNINTAIAYESLVVHNVPNKKLYSAIVTQLDKAFDNMGHICVADKNNI